MINAKRILFILLCIFLSSVAVNAEKYNIAISCEDSNFDMINETNINLFDSQRNLIHTIELTPDMENTQDVLVSRQDYNVVMYI